MSRGGLYAWRVDKSHSLFGLPFIGRHWGYGGMTNSYGARAGQHINGSVTYNTKPASWSDLRPKCYKVLPLPYVITHWKHGRKVMKALETLLIWMLCPVYNVAQQPPWNLRRKSKRAAARERARRDMLGFGYRATKFVIHATVKLSVIVGAYWYLVIR